MDKQPLSRRRFLKTVAVALPAGVVIADAALTVAQAQAKPGAPAAKPAAAALPKLSPADPAAKALAYTEDTNKVDKANPVAARHTKDQHCANCAQIQGKDGEAFRPCAIFPGKLVAANGWCSVWAKKA